MATTAYERIYLNAVISFNHTRLGLFIKIFFKRNNIEYLKYKTAKVKVKLLSSVSLAYCQIPVPVIKSSRP